jgi:hypothetical protein
MEYEELHGAYFAQNIHSFKKLVPKLQTNIACALDEEQGFLEQTIGI